MQKTRICSLVLALALVASAVCGCSAAPEEDELPLGILLDEGVPLAGSPAISTVLSPAASGTKVEKNSSAEVDYSNTKDGYFMVKWNGGGNPKLMVVVKGPSGGDQYQYYLRTDGEYDVFPLSDGNGKYLVTVNKNVSGTKYTVELSLTINAQMDDEFAPFLRPNQYVNYTENSRALQVAADEIAAQGAVDNLSKVRVIYDYVVNALTYDTVKAQTVKYDYLPDIDKVLSEGKGICFDYAALMAAMLRSQGVPVKLVVGYTSAGQKHAWINVWSETEGWVENMIFFNGQEWELMDPTFASSSKQSASIMKYIGNGSNYTAKYLY